MKIYCVSKNGKIRRLRPMRLLVSLIVLSGIIICLWFLASYIQILCHQLDYIDRGTHFDYPDWNAFFWFGRYFKFLFH